MSYVLQEVRGRILLCQKAWLWVLALLVQVAGEIEDPVSELLRRRLTRSHTHFLFLDWCDAVLVSLEGMTSFPPAKKESIDLP